MFLSVYEAYKRKDVFLDMFELYTAYLLRDQDARKLESPDSPIQKKVMTISGFAVNGKASKVTKLAISYAMAKGMAEAAPISMAVRTAINGSSYAALYYQATGRYKMNFLKKFILNIAIDYVPVLLVIVAGVFYVVFFPDYWGRILLITIAVIFVLSVKVFNKIQFKSKRK